jgi:hypothetical protein
VPAELRDDWGGVAVTASERDLLYRSSVSVTDRPASLAAVLRPSWRVPVTALLVGGCRSNRARREQLVVLNWAVRSASSAAALTRFMRGEAESRDVGIRYEPALVRAVNIAVGAGLLTAVESDWIELSDAGRELVEQIREQGLYEHERETLSALPKPLPFNAAQQLLRGHA